MRRGSKRAMFASLENKPDEKISSSLQAVFSRSGFTKGYFESKLGMYEALCKRRGFILRGGDFDYERGAKALIDELTYCEI